MVLKEWILKDVVACDLGVVLNILTFGAVWIFVLSIILVMRAGFEQVLRANAETAGCRLVVYTISIVPGPYFKKVFYRRLLLERRSYLRWSLN